MFPIGLALKVDEYGDNFENKPSVKHAINTPHAYYSIYVDSTRKNI